jgi:hypothetical protein
MKHLGKKGAAIGGAHVSRVPHDRRAAWRYCVQGLIKGAISLEDDDFRNPALLECEILTPTDVDVLSTIAHDLAKRSFDGRARVEGQSNGIARLKIAKPAEGGRSVYRERDLAAVTFDDASREVVLEIESAASL